MRLLPKPYDFCFCPYIQIEKEFEVNSYELQHYNHPEVLYKQAKVALDFFNHRWGTEFFEIVKGGTVNGQPTF